MRRLPARKRIDVSSRWSYVVIAIVVYGAALTANADGISELDDAAARMQYGFHTADVRDIEDALNLVKRVELPASLLGMNEYFTAYGYWKLAELYADEAAAGKRAARSEATKAASACVRAAQDATKLDARLAEGFAIEAVCSTLSSRIGNLLSPGGCATHKALRTARELASNNPRVLLIEAQCTIDGAKPATAADLDRLQRLVQAFESAPPSRPGRPDWGQAEALLMLGEAQLQRGDAVAARDTIERALVIAPDYHRARVALEQAARR